jgi:hypothetical protein
MRSRFFPAPALVVLMISAADVDAAMGKAPLVEGRAAYEAHHFHGNDFGPGSSACCPKTSGRNES